jgi:glutamyl-tRNA synthetase
MTETRISPEAAPRRAHYRGRIAPTPTGLLHLGHAKSFHTAAQRAHDHQGTLILRNEDLDAQRCKPEFVRAYLRDLRWLGISWQEGPDIGGAFGPYHQSERSDQYLKAWKFLRDRGHIYPCKKSRKDLQNALTAPHDDDREVIYPKAWRPPHGAGMTAASPAGVNWRFRVPDDEPVTFCDQHQGLQEYVAGQDFGDFLIWRRDNVPAYELAVVVDDIAMHITEVVRGADLLKSTARQLLLYRALQAATIPAFYHCPLVRDAAGQRLAKRHDALSLQALREAGEAADHLLASVS